MGTSPDFSAEACPAHAQYVCLTDHPTLWGHSTLWIELNQCNIEHRGLKRGHSTSVRSQDVTSHAGGVSSGGKDRYGTPGPSDGTRRMGGRQSTQCRRPFRLYACPRLYQVRPSRLSRLLVGSAEIQHKSSAQKPKSQRACMPVEQATVYMHSLASDRPLVLACFKAPGHGPYFYANTYNYYRWIGRKPYHASQ